MLSKLRDLLKPKNPESPQPSDPAPTPAAAPALNPAAWDELFEQAQSLQRQGQLERAIELYNRCIEQAPERFEAYYKRGNTLNGLGRLELALADYDQAVRLNPAHAYSFCNRGSVLERLGRRDEALTSYDRAIGLDPKDALTLYNRGTLLKDFKRYTDALASYDAALEIKGDFAEVHVNRGNVLQDLRRHPEAIDSFERAIAINPTIAHAFQGRAVSLHYLKHLEQALADYNKAIALKPDLAAAYQGRANLLRDVDRHEEAVTDYQRAIELQPDPGNYVALAESLTRLKRYDAAVASVDKASALDPDWKYLVGISRTAKMQAGSWGGLTEDLEKIARGVRDGKPVCHPMTLAALIDSPALQRSAAEIWVQDQDDGAREEDLRRMTEISRTPTARPKSSRIRVGYFSSDFRAHPVAYLTAGLFEHHDRANFEITAFAFGPPTEDPIRSRLLKAFDRFIDVQQKPDVEVAALARDLGIDIALDLNGFTANCRPRVFELRAAPIQINYLGFPGTMGAGFMDYLIADGMVVPRAQQAHYTERIAYLPGSFLPFDSNYAIADKTFTRAELGLPATAVVFCCFNNSYKVLPEVFDRWMRILSRTPDSVLWLQQANDTFAHHLRREAERRGIDGRRLIFAGRVPALEQHLSRLRVADLFLDTAPYNAHATALDALWAGVPLLTYPGESFASRVAASLVRTAGLPELIANSPGEYEEKALELAGNPSKLERLRRKLAARETSLFDTEQYTKNLEAVYRAIYEHHHSGAPPTNINDHFAT